MINFMVTYIAKKVISFHLFIPAFLHTLMWFLEKSICFSLDFLGGKRDYYLAGIGANVLHNGENCMVTTVTRL